MCNVHCHIYTKSAFSHRRVETNEAFWNMHILVWLIYMKFNLYILYSNVTCSTGMLARMKKAATINGLLGKGVSQQATSIQSTKRAQAARVDGTVEMFSRFAAWTAELYQKGILKNPWWGNDRMWGGDEVGFDPRGKVRKVSAFINLARRMWKSTTGEKAPFWVRSDPQTIAVPSRSESD